MALAEAPGGGEGGVGDTGADDAGEGVAGRDTMSWLAGVAPDEIKAGLRLG